MTNHRRRMQTRRRRIGPTVPVKRWPDIHNARIAQRMRWKRNIAAIGVEAAIDALILEALNHAAREATRQYRRLAATVTRADAAMRGHTAALTIRDEIRDFAAERAGLDRIANNGWDVSEEYAALAAEEAAYNEHREDNR